METRIFSYHWSIKVLKWFFILGAIAFPVNMILLVTAMFKLADAIAGRPDNAFIPAIIALLVTIVFSNFCILAVDRFPGIAIDNKGVSVRFLLKTVYIRWDEIIRIENHKTPWFIRKKDKLVFTKNFPFWYRMKNFIFDGLFKPGFIINSSIIDFDELVVSIQNRTNTT